MYLDQQRWIQQEGVNRLQFDKPRFESRWESCIAFSTRIWLKNKKKYMYLETEISVTEEPL